MQDSDSLVTKKRNHIMTSKIHNRARIRQIIDFDGLEWGKLRPTDIDLSIDWQGKTFVFVELKSAGTALTLGQRIHLEGLVKAIRAGGRLAWAVFAHHDTDVSEDVTAVSYTHLTLPTICSV